MHFLRPMNGLIAVDTNMQPIVEVSAVIPPFTFQMYFLIQLRTLHHHKCNKCLKLLLNCLQQMMAVIRRQWASQKCQVHSPAGSRLCSVTRWPSSVSLSPAAERAAPAAVSQAPFPPVRKRNLSVSRLSILIPALKLVH